MSIASFIEKFKMQNNPRFKAGIRKRNANIIHFTDLKSFFNSFVLIPIKTNPDLVALLEGI